MRNRWPIFLPLLLAIQGFGQIDAPQIDHWISTWPYANASKGDSLLIWADKLESAARAIDYPRGLIYATRIRGFHQELNGNIEEATKYFLLFLENARLHKLVDDEITAISDLVYTYINTSQYDLAKRLILVTLAKTAESDVSARKQSQLYNNLGIIYKRLEQIDSAVLAYEQALHIKSTLQDSSGMADLKINLAALQVNLGHFDEAIKLTNENIEYLQTKDNTPDLIYNMINKAGGHYGLLEYDTAFSLLESALDLAKKIGHDHFLELVLGKLSHFHQQQGQFQQAFEYLVESNKYKVEQTNKNAAVKIAELREAFEAEQREKENLVLSTDLQIEKNQKRLYLWGLLAMALLAATIAWALSKNRLKNRQLRLQNRLIRNQKDKLSQLNSEKNTLISIVSHDLSSPLNAIRIWAQGLTSEPKEDFEEARSMILKTADKALQSVRKILHVETGEIRSLDLEEVRSSEILDSLQAIFDKQAQLKGIQLDSTLGEDIVFITDREMLIRALENLLSNAIKYSPSHSLVQLHCDHKDDRVIFQVIDQGPGISKEEQSKLFDKYFQGNSYPTGGEQSTGLGLHIVKRIADELGATIAVDSTQGKGSVFTFSLTR